MFHFSQHRYSRLLCIAAATSAENVPRRQQKKGYVTGVYCNEGRRHVTQGGVGD